MSSKRIIGGLLPGLVLVLVLGAVAAPGAAVAAPESRYYLSLGDSIAAGWQPDPVTGQSRFTNQGYPDQLYRSLREAVPGLAHQKMGCPGETTVSMIQGPGNCYPGTSQLQAAVAFIAAHPGQLAFITIDVGVNDILSCLSAADPAACATTKIGTQVVPNLATILGTLRAAAGNAVPIVAMNYYNPYLAAWIEGIPPDGPTGRGMAQLTTQLAAGLNGAEGQVYAAFQVPVADVYGAFHTTEWRMARGRPVNVQFVCRLTWACSGPPVGLNIHPKRAGHALIALAFEGILEGYGIG